MADPATGPGVAEPLAVAPGVCDPDAVACAPVAGSAVSSAGNRSGVSGTVFVLGLIFALVAGFGIGRAAGPDTPPTSASVAGGTGGHSHGGGVVATGDGIGGLAVSAGGYTLVADDTTFTVGIAATLRFRILGFDGAPVTGYVVTHDRPLHMIIVRRDLILYRHLHPSMAADGTWSVPLTLPTPGPWRAYADFVVARPSGGQDPVTLGIDLTVPGTYGPTTLPAPATESTVAGYDVSLTGAPAIGVSRSLVFQVRRDGAPAPLEPYLGAFGHLVVVREGDLGYLHVHPDGQSSDAGIAFRLTTPSPGRYRAYLDFQVAGEVHTAEFTFQVE